MTDDYSDTMVVEDGIGNAEAECDSTPDGNTYDGAASAYLHSLPKPLDADGNFELFRKMRMATGAERDAIRERIICGNLRYVLKLALGFKCGTLADKIQDGNIGLMKAVDKYDLSKGVKFTGFAAMYIKQYIRVGLRREHTVKPFNVNRRKMTPEERAQYYPKMESLNAGVNPMDDESPERIDMLADETRPAYEAWDAEVIRGLVEKVKGAERRAICLYYGLAGESRMTYGRIADMFRGSDDQDERRMGTAESVRLAIQRGIRQIRDMLEA